MGIKFDEKTKTYRVYYSKRHPVTKDSIGLKRKKIKTHAEARRVEREIIIAVEEKIRSRYIPTWGDLTGMWAEDAANRGLTPKTIENYLYTLKAYTFTKWSTRLVDTITTHEVREIITIDLAGKSEHHKQGCLKFIRCVFQFGVDAGHLLRNPSPNMKFRLGDKHKKVLTRDHVERLLNTAKSMNCEWYPHWTMAIYTGMRSGELHALRWENVCFETKTILVNCSWNRKNGFKSTKSGDDRLVPIAPVLMTVLQELKLKYGSVSEFVLPRIGKWDKGDQARELRFFLSGMGIEPCRFHDLRATFATLLLQQGVPTLQVMKAGGWKSLKTMMHYVRKAGVDIQGMMDNFELHNPHRSEATLLTLPAQGELSGKS